MANLEVNAGSSVCRKCGRAYGRLKSNFPICYAYLCKGVGYLPYCSDCCKQIFDAYYAECGDARMAMRQMCRKFDIYWKDDIYERASSKTGTRTLFTNYISRVNNSTYAGKSYDDTLREEKTFWTFGNQTSGSISGNAELPWKNEKWDSDDDAVDLSYSEPIVITDDIIAFWGPGYTTQMYRELEQRLRYYKEQMDDEMQADMGTQALLRQIAMMEIDINKARASGVAVDKMVNSLNSLLSSLKKPQRKDSIDAANSGTPFGVWIKRWEDERPIPEVDPALKDVDGIVKYVTVWFFGHLCKMLGIKNSYCKMYEDELAKLRVDHPEYDEEDDDSMLDDLFGGAGYENEEELVNFDALVYGSVSSSEEVAKDGGGADDG